jgi:hypothetical protein
MRRVQKLERDDTDRIIAEGVGSNGVSFIRLLLQQPIIEIIDVEQHIQKSRGTATKLINVAEQLGIIQQISKGRRNRKYAYAEYVAILSEGTELN